MRIVIIGGGAVGLLFAARLLQANQRVQLVTRTDAQAEALCANGVILRDLHGKRQRIDIEAISSTNPLPEADLYLLTVKQTHVPALLPALHSIPAGSILVAMQNGMGHGEQLSKIIRDQFLYVAVNTEGARRISPIEVEHTGEGKLRIGSWKKQEGEDPAIARVLALLNRGGIRAEYVQDVEKILWDKLIANALINPLTAIHEVQNGMLLQSAELTAQMRQLFEEATAVADICGQKFNETTWQEILTICRNTSRNTSSMLQDLQQGKQTEIEAITGYLVQKAKEHGISTPGHETLRQVIRLKEQMNRLGSKHSGG
ncbi:ketopantoate reductase family protein [Brevibacillus migulae]|uniref:ketopantoate reductase family protein n=1 Tax=Brevibacillus migulae TaxID=1644114 RepID=UPI00106E2597|nr:2-dehydropantoate 2-reductase [Brevibacillus migulae]